MKLWTLKEKYEDYVEEIQKTNDLSLLFILHHGVQFEPTSNSRGFDRRTCWMKEASKAGLSRTIPLIWLNCGCDAIVINGSSSSVNSQSNNFIIHLENKFIYKRQTGEINWNMAILPLNLIFTLSFLPFKFHALFMISFIPFHVDEMSTLKIATLMYQCLNE